MYFIVPWAVMMALSNPKLYRKVKNENEWARRIFPC